jgi:hypothetical protein
MVWRGHGRGIGALHQGSACRRRMRRRRVCGQSFSGSKRSKGMARHILAGWRDFYRLAGVIFWRTIRRPGHFIFRG